MSTRILIKKPERFSFRHTIFSHGWSDLVPFEVDEKAFALTYVFRDCGDTPVIGRFIETGKSIRIELTGGKPDKDKIEAAARHILRLDDDMEEFYRTVAAYESLAWVCDKNAGRLLRSPTVFEDLVKTLCTTNSSWGLTKNMVANLTEKLGEPAPEGRHAFPTAEAMASVDEAFYRSEIKAGYRSPYFVELAAKVVSGDLDPEKWLTSELPTAELKKEIKSVKGFGDYASENLLKLLGRYDGLTLDSWLRARFYKMHNADKKCADKKIERHYAKYGEWKGLAIWWDMTESWFDERF
ncbi:MAG TPA: hypothetical protein VK468_02045 [Pyrinomonadaceae bacterium]|nr:hypothetical protein [Pyrinomonadaceae bacterium]